VKLQIQIPDEVYEIYQREAGRARRSPLALIQETLEKFATCSPVDRYLVVGPKIRERLEEIYHRQLNSQEDLLEAAERQAAIFLGTLRIDASPQQLEEAQNLATRQGITLEAYLQQRYKEVARFFFNASSELDVRHW
jgi:hypothetical protein